MKFSALGCVSALAAAAAVSGCASTAADKDQIYATYGVHNPPGDSPCTRRDCLNPRKAGEPADPIYPAYWQSRWTMYRVYDGYVANPPPYRSDPPAGTKYEKSYGASYYDSTWSGESGQGAMMEHYEKRCLPIFPWISNDFSCSFISLGNTAFFLTYDEDRPKGMPPVCLFSPLNHPPRRDFVKHLPYSRADSDRLGKGAQAYSFWIDGKTGRPIQTGASPDRTEDMAILFGYAFAPVNGLMQPQSFYFSGFPGTPPDAPIVAQIYQGFQATQPDPAKTWAKVSGVDPKTLPKCTVMQGGTPPLKAAASGAPREQKDYPSWFDIGRARRGQ
jgi:hypothetical protein